MLQDVVLHSTIFFLFLHYRWRFIRCLDTSYIYIYFTRFVGVVLLHITFQELRRGSQPDGRSRLLKEAQAYLDRFSPVQVSYTILQSNADALVLPPPPPG